MSDDMVVGLIVFGFMAVLTVYAAVVTYLLAKARNERDTAQAFYSRALEAHRALQQFRYVRDAIDWILRRDFSDLSIIEFRMHIQKAMVHDEEMRVEFEHKRVRGSQNSGPGLSS